MKKRALGFILSAAMIAGTLAGCGGGGAASTQSQPASGADAAATKVEAAADAGSGEGKVVNIEVWNDEFCNRMKDHYPGYVANDEADATKGGKIGDVAINFIVTDNQDNAYQQRLDEDLSAQADAADDDKIDMFLVEADNALKYVDAEADVAMPLADLGITDADLSKQYDYTKKIVTDANGVIRGSSWQACSAGLIFNREIAKQVLGSDDLDTVQEAVKDWDAFNATAQKMKEAGYKITATAFDTYRTYSDNISAPWVQDGKVVVDANIEKWVEASKTMVDNGMTTTNTLWSPDWNKGFQAPGDVFCYFGPAWLINFSMGAAPDQDDDGSIAHAGGWGFVNGPQNYKWGGTWLCAAQGTDNPTLVKDIILTMTTNDDVMKEIAVTDSECVNNKDVLKALAEDESFGNAILGGQNPYALLSEGAEKVDSSMISPYDQGCNEEFQNAMKNYFDGNATYEEALNEFKKAIVVKYPDLKTE